MNSIEITSTVTALANLIAENLQTDQNSLLTSILVQPAIRSTPSLRYVQYVKINKVCGS